jgi:hypothetical protein
VNKRPPLRVVLDRLTRNFVEGVLAALQSASLAEIESLGLGPLRSRRVPEGRTSARSSGRERPEPKARTRKASVAPPRTTTRRAAIEVDEDEAHPSVTITDPAAVLAMVEDGLHAASGAAEMPELLEVPEPEAPRSTSAAEPPRSERAEPSSRVELRPAARPGEEVLRASGGGLVLRRRRPQASAQRS